MSAKRVQDIFHRLRGLMRTPAIGTFRSTDEPMKFLKPPGRLRARLDALAAQDPRAWDMYIGKIDTESPLGK